VGSASEPISSVESGIRFADASDDKEDATIPGSDYPTTQESSKYQSVLPWDNGGRAGFEFFLIAASSIGVATSIIGLMVGLAMEECEPFHVLSGSLSTMTLGAVLLVFPRGRNAVIGTVIGSAFIGVALILLRCPQATDGLSVLAPCTNKVVKGPAEKYPFWNFVQGIRVVIGESCSRWVNIVVVSGGVVCAFARFLYQGSSTPDKSSIVISHEHWC
jgi:hypothetical protein